MEFHYQMRPQQKVLQGMSFVVNEGQVTSARHVHEPRTAAHDDASIAPHLTSTHLAQHFHGADANIISSMMRFVGCSLDAFPSHTRL